ncbi:MAG: hypothetical protein ACK4HW_08850 [Roseinatronobacter sp.]
MSRRDPRLTRLRDLADMIQTRELGRIAALNAACQQTEARIADLRAPTPWSDDPALFRARQAHLLWAQTESTRLMQRLALQKARLEEQKSKTARALGRSDVLARLAKVRR